MLGVRDIEPDHLSHGVKKISEHRGLIAAKIRVWPAAADHALLCPLCFHRDEEERATGTIIIPFDEYLARGRRSRLLHVWLVVVASVVVLLSGWRLHARRASVSRADL